MMEQEIKTTFEMGFVPTELTFSIEPQEKVDWTMFHYTYWKDRDYWETRLPVGLIQQFPCLEYMIDELYEANKDKTPLDEINERMGLYAKRINFVEDDDELLKINSTDDARKEMKQLMKDNHRELYNDELEYKIHYLEDTIKMHTRTASIMTTSNPNYVEQVSMMIEELKAELHA